MKKVVFLMPGQGAQFAGMGKEICDMYPEVEYVYDLADKVLGTDIKRMCFEGDIDELTRTENTQIAVFLSSVAAFKALDGRYNLEPLCFAGHSLGELTALVCAGSLELESAIRLVRARGIFMQEVSEQFSSKMVAVRNVPLPEIEEQCRTVSVQDHYVAIANYNAPNQIVLTGYKESVDVVVGKLRESGGDEIIVNVKTPFHTKLMEAAAARFADEVVRHDFKHPAYPVMSNVTGHPHNTEDDIADMLVKQITSPVKWIQTMEYLKNLEEDFLVIDMGPKDILKKLALSNEVGVPVFALSHEEDVKTLKQKYLSPKTVVSFISKALGIAVSLKNHNDHHDPLLYEQGVVAPYKRLEAIKATIQQQQNHMTLSDQEEIQELVSTIFEAKKTPMKEREERMAGLMSLVQVRTGEKAFV
ncbi:ACP S-malonyltransferase [Rossellomorea marisflavi]|uniref:ACP S-malonyltransferase n=1 Tax=Rossellomorea marisflavi TaxID=189381 RepID=UPI003458D3BB